MRNGWQRDPRRARRQITSCPLLPGNWISRTRRPCRAYPNRLGLRQTPPPLRQKTQLCAGRAASRSECPSLRAIWREGRRVCVGREVGRSGQNQQLVHATHLVTVVHEDYVHGAQNGSVAKDLYYYLCPRLLPVSLARGRVRAAGTAFAPAWDGHAEDEEPAVYGTGCAAQMVNQLVEAAGAPRHLVGAGGAPRYLVEVAWAPRHLVEAARAPRHPRLVQLPRRWTSAPHVSPYPLQ